MPDVRRYPPLSVAFENLEPGDILLFRPSIRIWPIQNFITYAQMFTRIKKHGHYDTTHVGIFVDRDEDGYRIAHINDTGFKIQKIGCPIKDYDSNERAFLVFRHKNKETQENIFRLATLESNENIKWDIYIAIRSLFSWSTLNPERKQKAKMKVLSDRSICSKFIAECVKQAARDLGTPEKHISTLTPKDLEAELYINDKYQMFLYPGKNLYLTLKNEITKQMHEVKSAEDHVVFTTVSHYLESPKLEINETYKAVSLLKVMVPILRAHGKVGSVEKIARKRGIFSREYENFEPQLVINFLKKARSQERSELNPEEISQLRPLRC